MLRFAAILAVLFAGCTTTKGVVVDQNVLAHGRKVMQAPAASPPFWEVRAGNQLSYLLGTIHIGVASGELPARIMFKLAESKVVYFEAADGVLETAFSPFTDQDLENQLSPKAWATLKERTGLPESRLRRLTPVGAILVLQVSEIMHLATSKQSSLDRELQVEAQRRGIEVRSLDTKELLDAAFKALEVSAADLNRFLQDDRTYNDFLRGLYGEFEAYKLGREVEKDQKEGPLAPAAVEAALLKRRNLTWIETLVPELKRGAVFVAVGSAHLYGKNGLIELLRQRGFEVRAQ